MKQTHTSLFYLLPYLAIMTILLMVPSAHAKYHGTFTIPLTLTVETDTSAEAALSEEPPAEDSSDQDHLSQEDSAAPEHDDMEAVDPAVSEEPEAAAEEATEEEEPEAEQAASEETP